MAKNSFESQQHIKTRNILRVLGVMCLIFGVLLMFIGVGSFFMAFSTGEPPGYFWCAFLGMPMLFAGGVMTNLGFLGAINRYVATETSPVAKDVVNYMGEETQPGVKAFAQAVSEGIKECMKDEDE